MRGSRASHPINLFSLSPHSLHFDCGTVSLLHAFQRHDVGYEGDFQSRVIDRVASLGGTYICGIQCNSKRCSNRRLRDYERRVRIRYPPKVHLTELTESRTTGGKGGASVTATTWQEFEAAIKGDEPKIILVSGTIKGEAKARVGSNKSIIGKDSSARKSPLS